jgi:hypothetical protein
MVARAADEARPPLRLGQRLFVSVSLFRHTVTSCAPSVAP